MANTGGNESDRSPGDPVFVLTRNGLRKALLAAAAVVVVAAAIAGAFALGRSTKIHPASTAAVSPSPRTSTPPTTERSGPESTTTTTKMALPTTVPAPTTTVPAPTTTVPLPTVSIGNYTGVEPTTIDFSGDAGNIAVGLQWSAWGPAGAVATGIVNIQGCVPDCASGSETPTPTTIRLSDDVNGQFATLEEDIQGDPPVIGPALTSGAGAS